MGKVTVVPERRACAAGGVGGVGGIGGGVGAVGAVVVVAGLLALPPAAAVIAAPAARAAGGEIRVSLAADHLVLDGRGQLDVGLDLPAGAELAQLSVNVGRIGPPRSIAPGRYVARFTPPDRFFPQVAIVAASGVQRGRPIAGWAALPLWGKGDAMVHTKPGAEVSVRIGDRSHGPVVADARGVAFVPVVVPPGVRFGRSEGRQVDLNMPPMSHLGAVAAPARFAGVTRQRLRVWLIVVDDAGSPAAGRAAAPTLNAFGTAVKPLPQGAGVWSAELDVPAGLPARLEATASLPDDPVSVARLELERTPGPPSRLALELAFARAPAPAPAGGAGRGADPVPLRARLADALGTTVDGQVSGSASAGTLERFVRRGPGFYEALWRPPPGDAAAKVRIRVSVAGGPTRELEPTLGAVRRRLPSLWFWTAAATSAALLVAGGAMRGAALAQSDEYKRLTTSIERRRDLKQSGEALTTASSVLFGVGAAAAVGAAVLGYFTYRSAARGERTVSLSAAPLSGGGQLGLAGQF